MAIIGSGISGTLAAAALARLGASVTLIDRHPVYPVDFRAEHLDGPMIEQLRRLGFLTDLTADVQRGETVTIGRNGHIVTRAATTNYGLRYESLVNRARATLPGQVRRVTGKVTYVSSSAAVQTVRMADGQVFAARLLVLATGQNFGLVKQLGIRRRIIRENHSLTFGFYIEPDGGNVFDESFFIYQREQVRDRMDYFAAFTMGRSMRVNLFTYRDYKESWTKSFLADPDAGLRSVMPRLGAVLGPYRASGPVVARPVDLYVSEDCRRDGVVLIGDAFQVACPATGMGMVKVLTDIERLVTVYVPQWLATPGMGAEKIAAFYDDPVKRACDAKALHDAEYRRAVSTETGLRWMLHRTRLGAMQRIMSWMNRADAAKVNPRLNADAGKVNPRLNADAARVNPRLNAGGAEPSHATGGVRSVQVAHAALQSEL